MQSKQCEVRVNSTTASTRDRELKGVTLELVAHLHTHDTNSKYARDISHLGEFMEEKIGQMCLSQRDILHPPVIL